MLEREVSPVVCLQPRDLQGWTAKPGKLLAFQKGPLQGEAGRTCCKAAAADASQCPSLQDLYALLAWNVPRCPRWTPSSAFLPGPGPICCPSSLSSLYTSKYVDSLFSAGRECKLSHLNKANAESSCWSQISLISADEKYSWHLHSQNIAFIFVVP